MYYKRIEDMVDPDDCEACAMDDASNFAWAYINELLNKGTKQIGDKIAISSADRLYLPNWSPEDWKGLFEVVITGYVDSIQSQHDKIQRSMNKITHIP